MEYNVHNEFKYVKLDIIETHELLIFTILSLE